MRIVQLVLGAAAALLALAAWQGWPWRDEWRHVAGGGDNDEGNIGGRGRCPCQKEYTVATRRTWYLRPPNRLRRQACLLNPPAPAPAEWKCAEDCVQVMTHVWHGWTLVRSRWTGIYQLNCHTFAQYHCKRPDDPDVERPPARTPPPPDVAE